MFVLQFTWLLGFSVRSLVGSFKPLAEGENYNGPESLLLPRPEAIAQAARRLNAAHVPYTEATGKAQLKKLFGGYAASDTNLQRWWAEAPRGWTNNEKEALRKVLIALHVPIQNNSVNPCAWEIVHCYRGDDVALYYIFASGLGYGGLLDSQWIGSLQGLRLLRIDQHKLGATIPKELGNIAGLELISLTQNDLEGSFPKEIANCKNMFWINAPKNRLSGEVPLEWYTQLTNMLWWSIYGNHDLTGLAIPPEIKYWKKLEIVGLSHTKMHGSVPQELGQLTKMAGWWQTSTDMSGTIPSGTFGNMKDMGTLELPGNQLSGTIPPDILSLPKLKTWKAADNSFSGSMAVDTALGPFLPKATSIDLRGNMLEGNLPNMSDSVDLIFLDISNNRIAAGGVMAPNIITLQAANNMLQSLPYNWGDLTSIRTLDLSNNRIQPWPRRGVFEPIGWNYQRFTGCPANEVLAPRFKWQKLKTLSLNGNPLNMDVRDFMHSLGYLPVLTTLEAKNCQLFGDIPMEISEFVPTHDSIGDMLCDGRSVPITGFQTLMSLVLSDNLITGILAFPPPVLTFADFSNNIFTRLHDAWWNADGSFQLNELVLKGNSLLLAPVIAQAECPSTRTDCPSSPELSGYCPDGIPDVPCPMKLCLVTNLFRFQPEAGHEVEGYECTTLCRVGTGYVVDYTLNSSMMCRCQVGYGGQGRGCTRCPVDHYSLYVDNHSLVSDCHPCPANSNTQGIDGQTSPNACICNQGFYRSMSSDDKFICKPCPLRSTTPDSFLTTGATSIWACQCDQGFFAENNASGEVIDNFFCAPCPAFSNTTSRGATKESACQCLHGVAKVGNACGCEDDMFMNHVTCKCDPCMGGLDCEWDGQFEKSLLPPHVLPSYWTAKRDGAITSFSGYDVYRCFSKRTCVGSTDDGSVRCAEGRYERACSLCKPGTYGGFDVLIIVRSVMDDNDTQAALQQIRSMRTTFRQLIKYFQMLGIIANFEVRWPKVCIDFLQTLGSISVNVNDLFATSCMVDTPSVWFDMCCRWFLPFLVLLLCFLAGWVSPAMAFVFRKSPSSKLRGYSPKLPFSGWTCLKLAQMMALLFFSSVMQNGFIPLNCATGPNKVSTIVGYPHVDCYTAEWWQYFAPSAVYIFVFGILFIVCVFWMTRHIAISLGNGYHDSSMERIDIDKIGNMRGPYKFVSEDFRDACTQWPGYILLKDFTINVICCAFAGDGTMQLMLSAFVYLYFSFAVLLNLPFIENSNSIMEAWSNLSLFVICVFSSGMGFQNTPDLSDISGILSEGTDNPAYKIRTLWLFSIMVVSVIGPAAILVYQCLFLHPSLTKAIPKKLQGLTDERRVDMEDTYREALTNTNAMIEIIRKMDKIEFKMFHQLMLSSPATLGHLDSDVHAQTTTMRRAFTGNRRSPRTSKGTEGSTTQSGSQLSLEDKSSKSKILQNQPTAFTQKATTKASMEAIPSTIVEKISGEQQLESTLCEL